MSAKRQFEGGFTLIELLVVIAIIAVLASLLLSALSVAKAKAYSIKCMSNLRTIGHGMKIYANDNKNQYPRTLYADGSSTYFFQDEARPDPFTGPNLGDSAGALQSYRKAAAIGEAIVGANRNDVAASRALARASCTSRACNMGEKLSGSSLRATGRPRAKSRAR